MIWAVWAYAKLTDADIINAQVGANIFPWWVVYTCVRDFVCNCDKVWKSVVASTVQCDFLNCCLCVCVGGWGGALKLNPWSKLKAFSDTLSDILFTCLIVLFRLSLCLKKLPELKGIVYCVQKMMIKQKYSLRHAFIALQAFYPAGHFMTHWQNVHATFIEL